jgi:hypothetical protein
MVEMFRAAASDDVNPREELAEKGRKRREKRVGRAKAIDW